MSYSHAVWRLLRAPPARGAWNMALDEAILETAGRGDEPPTLRLYAWFPPCLSLGYAQPLADVSWEALESRGWELVRRPTGGRAILHTDELTYSVAGPLGEQRLAGGVLESYRTLAGALLRALILLGIPAQALEKPSPPGTAEDQREAGERVPSNQGKNPVCFEMPSNYEITVGGKKLIGSAQARRKEGLLQHGSLPLHGDLERITQVLAFPDRVTREAAAERLSRRATTAERVLGRPLPWEQAAQAFVHAFQEILDLDLELGEPTRAEWLRAEELVGEKYANPKWTGRI